MTAGIARLQKRIDELEAFDPAKVSQRGAPEVQALKASIEETLERVFDRHTTESARYAPAAHLDDGPSFGDELPIATVRQYLQKDKESSLALLRQAVRGLQEEISAQSAKAIDY